jgi:hypothetical protein
MVQVGGRLVGGFAVYDVKSKVEVQLQRLRGGDFASSIPTHPGGSAVSARPATSLPAKKSTTTARTAVIGSSSWRPFATMSSTPRENPRATAAAYSAGAWTSSWPLIKRVGAALVMGLLNSSGRAISPKTSQ